MQEVANELLHLLHRGVAKDLVRLPVAESTTPLYSSLT